MKAKYSHYGNDCVIYEQVICEDNIIVTVRSYQSNWFDVKPAIETKVCLTNAEARALFCAYCSLYEKNKYECIYKED